MNREQFGRLLGYLILFLLAVGVPYLLFAFVSWSFNPGNWHEMTRGICALIMAGAIALTALLLFHPASRLND